jgi:hypothetical protein
MRRSPTATTTDELLARIRAENLDVYRASPNRLREDLRSEAEIAHDYRGRLVYELLQNADDAMLGNDGPTDRIVFRLTDTDLWVGNSGRPLDSLDVEGLCGTGISTKTVATGPRRASIGHKGMGFKSVLEVTERPAAFSTGHSFVMSAAKALGPVGEVFADRHQPVPRRVPSMRFPWPVDAIPAEWTRLHAEGITTLFRFPLRRELGSDKRAILANRLLALPVTAVVFLKHLARVDVDIDTSGSRATRSFSVRRQRHTDSRVEDYAGLDDTGIYRVSVRSEDGTDYRFLLAHNADVPIGSHRGGLDAEAWAGVSLTEVSVATPWPVDGPAPDGDWRRFHVFLPTAEKLPQRLLVNGAFATDLSRQEIRVGQEADDYNRYLATQAARVLRDQLIPALLSEGEPAAVLGILDRGDDPIASPIASVLHDAIREHLIGMPLVPLEQDGSPLSITDTVVPPLALPGTAGARFRALLPADARFERWGFPADRYCAGRLATVLVDLGARELSGEEAVEVLAAADPGRSAALPHGSADLRVDPVLASLEELWRSSDEDGRRLVELRARELPLFPVSVSMEGGIERTPTIATTCFYPPRSLAGSVPLHGLSFLAQPLCWGNLSPRERNDVLRDRLPVWQALFDIREFKFAEVMRAAVLPALALDQENASDAAKANVHGFDQLAAICQLAGRSPKPESPLPYQRLGADRALFNLARLPVPCRPSDDGVVPWLPAFRVYFGRDWAGDDSVEDVFEMAALVDPDAERPEIPYLASPEMFRGYLGRYQGLQGITDDEGNATDEVGLDEDEEQPFETDEYERWRAFLRWIGVNRALRAVHFHDVEEERGGWLQTRGLVRPEGAAFGRVSEELWRKYRASVEEHIARADHFAGRTAYFHRLHDLEYANFLLSAAAKDKTASVAEELFLHLARNWSYLDQYARLVVALVPADRSPSQRGKPIRPLGDETFEMGDDFWLWRLRQRSVVPTSHGPRKPSQCWLPSAEIQRRFGRRGTTSDALVPIVTLPNDHRRPRALAFAKALGVREEFTPATFRAQDAKALATRLMEICPRDLSTATDTFALDDRWLRQVARPAYRNLFELVVGSVERIAASTAPLADVPLLEMDGAGRYRFRPGEKVLYQDRTGTRDRIGAVGQLWTFVLEAAPSARAPLTRLFGARLLEEAIRWSPSAGEPRLDAAEERAFREGLRALRPYLLARLQADRNEEAQVRQDARRLDAFLLAVQPVEELSVSCWLDDRQLTVGDRRDAYVETADNRVTAFLRWGETGWPPSLQDAEALASALSDLFQVGMFESFLALANVRSDEGRMRLLRLAGAPTDLDEVLAVVEEEPAPEAEPPVVASKTASGTEEEDEPVVPPASANRPVKGRIPLWRPEDIVIEGVPVIVRGERGDRTGSSGGHDDGRAGDGAGAGYGATATDLDELNQLGMSVAIGYEVQRLHRLGATGGYFDPRDPESAQDALVFDVSTPAAVAVARRSSEAFRRAMASLAELGVSADWPGFDLLALGAGQSEPGRLIELKSSGVNAQIQAMTWNEWKSARDSRLREQFWLYLVGNLRSDLAAARPFIRAVRDPFGSLLTTVVTAPVRRAVQLDLRDFTEAEHLELGVREG